MANETRKEGNETKIMDKQIYVIYISSLKKFKELPNILMLNKIIFSKM